MAMIRPGPLVSSIRGSIGGVTFTRGRAGAVARINRKPKDPWSPAQSYSRATYTILRGRWTSHLTQTQRDGWDTLAAIHHFHNALGDDSHLPGLALFLFANITRLSVGFSALDTVPAHPVLDLPYPELEWNAPATRFRLFFQPYDNLRDVRVRFQLSPPLSLGVRYFTDPWPWSTHARINEWPWYQDIPLLADPALPPCRRFFVRIRAAEDTGAVSFPLIFPAESN